MSEQFNWYTVKRRVVTARRAQIMGLQPQRPYGYYVLVDRWPSCFSNSIESWCKTKSIAERQVRRHEDAKVKGYYGCLCGSGKQAQGCCGIPKQED